MFGSTISIPYSAEPSVLAGMSRRGTLLPITAPASCSGWVGTVLFSPVRIVAALATSSLKL